MFRVCALEHCVSSQPSARSRFRNVIKGRVDIFKGSEEMLFELALDKLYLESLLLRNILRNVGDQRGKSP